jgi:hypothetical protein
MMHAAWALSIRPSSRDRLVCPAHLCRNGADKLTSPVHDHPVVSVDSIADPNLVAPRAQMCDSDESVR